MLNTHKLLYILPDVTYVAELLPGKKEHSFAVQAFRQINGEFLNDEEEFIPSNIEKLFSKIEADAYHLILPDFLFTNTILEIKETSETKVKEYIKETLLPQLGLSKETHEISAFILTQYGGVTKIQLTALEKEVLDAIVVSAKNHDVTIQHISPLTWTLKSVISLEPSISVVQIGSMLYTAEHYIGVDQCTVTKVEEIENVGETIKTLKGAQPSIQTVYLLTNSLVEDKLKELVSSTLPIQQLTTGKDEDSQMPPYVKQIVESGMKTLDIPDFSVPSFALPKDPSGKSLEGRGETRSETDAAPEPKAEAAVSAEVPEATQSSEPETSPQPPKAQPLAVFDEEDRESSDTSPASNKETEALPTPTLPPVMAAAELGTLAAAANSVPETASQTTITTVSSMVGSVTTHQSDTESESRLSQRFSADDLSEDEADALEIDEFEPSKETAFDKAIAQSSEADDARLAQFASHSTSVTSESEDGQNIQTDTIEVDNLVTPATAAEGSVTEATAVSSTSTTLAKRPVIKNTGTNQMMHKAFITLVVFGLTVAIVGGAGFAFLTWSSNRPAPVTQASPSPIPSTLPVVIASPSPVASASATVDKEATSILVVNATTKAGYAGTTTRTLKSAGYSEVTARNARGEYDPGTYILLAENDPALVRALAADSELDLEFAPGKTTEDPTNQYDLVIVLAE